MFRNIIFLIIIITISCMVFASMSLADWWNQPLGEPLAIPSYTVGSPTSIVQMETEQPRQATQVIQTPNIIPNTPVPSETPVPETPEPLDEKPGPLYILLAGIASTDPEYRFGLADAIRIVRVDFETPKVTVLTLPRDLWVELPGIKEQYEDLTHGKLNTSYSYGSPAFNYYAGDGGGPGLLAHTIAHNYGLTVDHYAVINMNVFSDIVDALGGIDLYLDRTWDGRIDRENPDHDAWVFEEGLHHMKGEEALRFARIRLNYTEIARTDNQTHVMCAIREKALRPNVLPSIPDLVNAFIGRVQTDLSPAQIGQLILLLPKLSRENLLFIRFPNDMMVPGRIFDPSLNNTTFVWDIPIEDIRAFIRDFEQDAITIEIGGGGGQICP